MQVEIIGPEKADELQESALVLSAMKMASGGRIGDVAREIGVNETTVYRWRKTEDWQRAYKAAQAEIINRARSRLVALTETALNRIEDHLREDDPDRSRKMAAQVDTAWKVLKHAGVEVEVQQQEAPRRIVTRLPQATVTAAPVEPVVTVEEETLPAPGPVREVRRGW
jgi:dihydroneopterin aldolase